MHDSPAPRCNHPFKPTAIPTEPSYPPSISSFQITHSGYVSNTRWDVKVWTGQQVRARAWWGQLVSWCSRNHRQYQVKFMTSRYHLLHTSFYVSIRIFLIAKRMRRNNQVERIGGPLPDCLVCLCALNSCRFLWLLTSVTSSLTLLWNNRHGK